MNAAFELESEYTADGKIRKRKWSVGGIVVWGIVVLALGLSGYQLITLPDSIGSVLLSRTKEALAPLIPRPSHKTPEAGKSHPRGKLRSMVSRGASVGAPCGNSAPQARWRRGGGQAAARRPP
jgi:hypothetical protein